MSYDAARKSIQSYFAANWSATPVAYDNVAFTPPDDSEWVRLSIRNNLSSQITIGSSNQTYRRRGIAFLQIFTPRDGGPELSATLTDTAVNIFEGQKTGPVVFESVNVNEVGNTDDGWFQVNVSASYRFDDVK